MKKITALAAALCLLFFLFAGCTVGNTPTPSATSGGGTSAPETAEPAPASLTVADYFPVTGDVRYVYEGEGSEYASYDVYIDYASEDRVQRRTDNGGTVTASVLSLADGRLTRVYSAAEAYYRENLLDREGEEEVLLMEPIAAGTSWTLADGRTRAITGVSVEVSTPYGDFEAVEVTTEGADAVSTDYYALGVGLVQTVFSSGEAEVTSSLSAVEANAARTQAVRLFYPDAGGEKVCYVDKDVTFATNDVTGDVLAAAYREVPAGLAPVFSANTAINSLTLGEDGAVYLDLSQAFLTEMSAGSGMEALILDSVADTFAYYYGAARVVLTLDGAPYSSGHFSFAGGEALEADPSAAVPAQ